MVSGGVSLPPLFRVLLSTFSPQPCVMGLIVDHHSVLRSLLGHINLIIPFLDFYHLLTTRIPLINPPFSSGIAPSHWCFPLTTVYFLSVIFVFSVCCYPGAPYLWTSNIFCDRDVNVDDAMVSNGAVGKLREDWLVDLT